MITVIYTTNKQEIYTILHYVEMRIIYELLAVT